MQDVIDKLTLRSAITPPQRHRGVFLIFDPEANKRVLDQVCLDAGVDISLHSRAIRAERNGDRVTAITVETHGECTDISGGAFVDATGEATLAHLAGASTRYGNDGHVNLGSMATRFGGIPGGTIITADDIAAAVSSLRDQGAGPFSKDRSVVCRLPGSGDLVIYVVSEDYDPRSRESITRAEISGRMQAESYLSAVQSIKGCEGAYLVSTGPEFGTRESRHLNCRYQLTWDDIGERRAFDDCIALGAWGAEWHERKTMSSYMEFVPDKSYYQIPLRCLQSVDVANLCAAGRTVDGDQNAGAAIRVLGTAMATGQAAGIAAAQFADKGTNDVPQLQHELRRQGCVATPEDIPD